MVYSSTKGCKRILFALAILIAGCALNDPKYGPLRPARCEAQLNVLNVSLKADPDNAAFLAERGSAYICNQQYDLALEDLNQAIAKHPTAQAYILRASVHLHDGKSDLAINDLNSAIRIDPNNATPYLQLGGVYGILGSVKLANVNLDHALAIGGDNPLILNGYAWCRAVSPTPGVVDGAAALKYSTRANELASWQDPRMLDTLAAAYARDGQFDQAVKWEREAIRLASDRLPVDAMKHRLAIYQSGQSYTQTTFFTES